MTENKPPQNSHVLPDPHPLWAEPARATSERYRDSVRQEEPPKPARTNPPILGDDFRKGTGPEPKPRRNERGR